MSALRLLIGKDFTSELRSKETLSVHVAMSLMLTTVVSLSLQSSFLAGPELTRVFPALLWLIFIFSSTLSVARTLEYEFEDMAIEGLRLIGVNLSLIFAAKIILLVCLLAIGNLVAFVSLAILLNLSIFGILPVYFVVLLLVLLGFAPLALLFSAMTMRAKLKGLLLPMIIIPLLFPLIFAAVELTTALVLKEELGLHWFCLLLVFDLLYLSLSAYFFGEAIKS